MKRRRDHDTGHATPLRCLGDVGRLYRAGVVDRGVVVRVRRRWRTLSDRVQQLIDACSAYALLLWLLVARLPHKSRIGDQVAIVADNAGGGDDRLVWSETSKADPNAFTLVTGPFYRLRIDSASQTTDVHEQLELALGVVRRAVDGFMRLSGRTDVRMKINVVASSSSSPPLVALGEAIDVIGGGGDYVQATMAWIVQLTRSAAPDNAVRRLKAALVDALLMSTNNDIGGGGAVKAPCGCYADSFVDALTDAHRLNRWTWIDALVRDVAVLADVAIAAGQRSTLDDVISLKRSAAIDALDFATMTRFADALKGTPPPHSPLPHDDDASLYPLALATLPKDDERELSNTPPPS